MQFQKPNNDGSQSFAQRGELEFLFDRARKATDMPSGGAGKLDHEKLMLALEWAIHDTCRAVPWNNQAVSVQINTYDRSPVLLGMFSDFMINGVGIGDEETRSLLSWERFPLIPEYRPHISVRLTTPKELGCRPKGSFSRGEKFTLWPSLLEKATALGFEPLLPEEAPQVVARISDYMSLPFGRKIYAGMETFFDVHKKGNFFYVTRPADYTQRKLCTRVILDPSQMSIDMEDTVLFKIPAHLSGFVTANC